MSTFSFPFLCRNASQNQENMETSLKQYYFSYLNILDFPTNCQFGKRRAPKHPEESYNEMLRIMNLRSISIKKHEWFFANMVPISTTKHKVAIGEL